MSEPTPRTLPGFTPAAWGLLAVTAACALGAVLLRYAELAAFAGAGAAALFTAVAAVARPPRVTVTTRVTPAAVTRGDDAALVISIVNHSRWTSPPFALRLPAEPAQPGEVPAEPAEPAEPGGSVGSGGPEIAVDIRPLRGGASREIVLPLDTAARGVRRIGPPQVHRSDPFGLAHRHQYLGTSLTLRVRPRAYPLVPPPAAPARDPDGQSGRGASGGLMFHTLREYTPGEDLRLVHWAASARTGTLMVRTHLDPSEPASTVVLDTRRRAYPPGPVGAAVFEDAVDVAASAVLACARNSYGVRLVTSGGVRMTGRRRSTDAESLLDELADVRPDEGVTLDVLRTLRRGPVGTLVLVTGALDRDAAAALAPVAHVFGQVIVLRMGPRSEAAALARGRRAPGDRPRLRPSMEAVARARAERGGPVAPAGPTRSTGSAGAARTAGATRMAGVAGVAGAAGVAGSVGMVGTAGSGRVRMIHLGSPADLTDVWPAAPLPPRAPAASPAAVGSAGSGSAGWGQAETEPDLAGPLLPVAALASAGPGPGPSPRTRTGRGAGGGS
ncbi:DUF58 domain-containing protein [Parafrankia sp. BMG5.11]|uniref:DUF58 domain-containing protein n=1 Tax=Parafrankia sp. BMG5.11 TaxID=222540 RepID=UPI00103884EC|nr:DUF58 domain-containing protein [Parafrankia sp. BMG5.11]TCJ32532.1 DUF58 domain-containing protein [Parafrankia sp. BMG5.11]